jgi:hypothetical protein
MHRLTVVDGSSEGRAGAILDNKGVAACSACPLA